MAEKMHTNPGCSLRQDLFDAVLFAEVLLANVLNLDAVVGRQFPGVLPQSVSERLGKAWIVENPDFVLVQVRSHASSKADLRQRTEHQHAGKHERTPAICAAYRSVSSVNPIQAS